MDDAPHTMALGELRRRCPLAGESVNQVWRSDARLTRARLLLLLHETAAPIGQPLRVAWYVPGAVARCSPAALCRLWRARFGFSIEERTLRRHLAWAEREVLIVRAPGDPHASGRYADTLHLVRDVHERRWWRRRGLRRLLRCPASRFLLRAWQAAVGGWRERVRAILARLKAWRRPLRGQPRRDLAALRLNVLDAGAGGLMAALHAAGVRVSLPWRYRLCQHVERLRAASCHLIERIDALGWPRDPGGWLVWSWRSGGSAPSEALHRRRRRREGERPAFDVLGSLGLRGVLRAAPAATPADLLAGALARI